MNIPKKIHYVLLNDDDSEKEEISKLIKDKHKGFDIYFWTKNDIPQTEYVKKCLEMNYDYPLLNYFYAYLLNKHGGFCLDTEIISNINQDSISSDVILLKETDFLLSPLVIASSKAHRFTKKLLEFYDNCSLEDVLKYNFSYVYTKIAITTFGRYSILNANDSTLKSNNIISFINIKDLLL